MKGAAQSVSSSGGRRRKPRPTTTRAGTSPRTRASSRAATWVASTLVPERFRATAHGSFGGRHAVGVQRRRSSRRRPPACRCAGGPDRRRPPRRSALFRAWAPRTGPPEPGPATASSMATVSRTVRVTASSHTSPPMMSPHSGPSGTRPGRQEPHQPTLTGRDADGTAPVRGMPDRHHARRHRYGRATARAATGVGGVPRVAGGPVGERARWWAGCRARVCSSGPPPRNRRRAAGGSSS